MVRQVSGKTLLAICILIAIGYYVHDNILLVSIVIVVFVILLFRRR